MGSNNLYQNQPKWFNSSIRHNINRVRTLRRKFNKCPSKQNEIKLKNLEKLLQAEISSAKADYESIKFFLQQFQNLQVHLQSN